MKSKAVIIYNSKYGTTKEYSKWLANELGCDIYGKKAAGQIDFNLYDTVIYGAGVYAGGIGASTITGRWDSLKDKNIIVFTVGLSDPENTDNSPIIDNNFNDEQKERIKFFHLRGGIDYKRLGIIHKAMMAMLVSVLKRKGESELSEENKQFIASYGDKVDFTDKNALKPIIEYITGTNV